MICEWIFGLAATYVLTKRAQLHILECDNINNNNNRKEKRTAAAINIYFNSADKICTTIGENRNYLALRQKWSNHKKAKGVGKSNK